MHRIPGKGLAVLSLDKEYQRERMEQQNRRTDNISATMAQGGRGVVMGVYEGVTGVVMKPISGAKEEGVGGFFKGVGKGMMGLVTRPVTGVIDFASTSLNAVKRFVKFLSQNQSDLTNIQLLYPKHISVIHCYKDRILTEVSLITVYILNIHISHKTSPVKD